MASAFISRYQLKPDKRDEFIKTLKSMYEGARSLLEQETHFTFYGFGRDENEFVAIESWKNEAVVNALRASDEFQRSFIRLMSCVAAPMQLEIFRGWDDDKSVFDCYPSGPSKVHPATGAYPTIFT